MGRLRTKEEQKKFKDDQRQAYYKALDEGKDCSLPKQWERDLEKDIYEEQVEERMDV